MLRYKYKTTTREKKEWKCGIKNEAFHLWIAIKETQQMNASIPVRFKTINIFYIVRRTWGLLRNSMQKLRRKTKKKIKQINGPLIKHKIKTKTQHRTQNCAMQRNETKQLTIVASCITRYSNVRLSWHLFFFFSLFFFVYFRFVCKFVIFLVNQANRAKP